MIQVCSQCFLKLFHQRLLSPLLRAGEWTTYLQDEHANLESVCGTSMALPTSSSTLFLGTVPAATPTTSQGASATSNTAATTTTCAGQLIPAPSGPTDCHRLSQDYNVTTGDLTVLTGEWDCFTTSEICAPAPCALRKIGWGETCETLRASIATPADNITAVQFSDWNPRIIGSCDDVRGDQYICTSPPGGAYAGPPPVYAPTSASDYYSTAVAPLPTSDGTTASCGKYYSVAAGDTCQNIVLQR